MVGVGGRSTRYNTVHTVHGSQNNLATPGVIYKLNSYALELCLLFHPSFDY